LSFREDGNPSLPYAGNASLSRQRTPLPFGRPKGNKNAYCLDYRSVQIANLFCFLELPQKITFSARSSSSAELFRQTKEPRIKLSFLTFYNLRKSDNLKTDKKQQLQ
jgi:hypothetical protein